MRRRNRVTVDLKFLESVDACQSGIDYWLTLPKKERKSLKWLIQHAIESNTMSVKKDANWLVTRCLSRKNRLRYAINAAESVLHIYEERHPNDDRPRKAIKAAKDVLKLDNAANREKAKNAAAAADAAADAYAANANAYADAASYAAAAAAADAYAANANAYAYAANANAYAYAAADASYANADRTKIMNECLSCALELLED